MKLLPIRLEIKDGKPVTGNREEQWPNRRDEIAAINA